MIGRLAVALLVGYLCGSLMPAIWLTRLAKDLDIRERGSLNAGTSNVFMEAGPVWGALTFLGDLAKLAVPLILARHAFHQPMEVLMAMGLGGVIGHDFPLWFGFRGGKGTASAIALAFCLHWAAGAAVVLTLIIAALVSDCMAIGGMAAMAALPVSLFLLGFSPFVVGPALALPMLSILMHRSNIRRIIDGTEPHLLSALGKAGKAASSSQP